MDSVDTPLGSIVVGIDGSPCSESALVWAADQAALEGRPLVLAHAVEPAVVPSAGPYAAAGMYGGEFLDDLRSAAQSLLSAAAKRSLARHPGLEVHQVLHTSDPRSALLELGETATMVVVGSRGRGPITSLLLGSVSVSVSKHATCPVVVVRPPDPSRPGLGILVGVDGLEDSMPAVEFAYRVASLRRRPLTVVHCYWTSRSVAVPTATSPDADMSDERALVAESLAGMTEKFPDVDVEVRLVLGDAEQELITSSADHDLVVVGHHRTTALDDVVYGSLAPAVLEHARGAVAVVPAVRTAVRRPS